MNAITASKIHVKAIYCNEVGHVLILVVGAVWLCISVNETALNNTKMH